MTRDSSGIFGLPPQTKEVLGDARLTLCKIPDGACGLIFMDALSSGAIPPHHINFETLASA